MLIDMFIVFTFFCPWTRFLSINSFDLQLNINSEARHPFDLYCVKSYIGLPFGDSQHVILMNENGNKAINRYDLNKGIHVFVL
jgi:hypothetical protein